MLAVMMTDVNQRAVQNPLASGLSTTYLIAPPIKAAVKASPSRMARSNGVKDNTPLTIVRKH